MGYIDGIHVTINIAYMDPMGFNKDPDKYNLLFYARITFHPSNLNLLVMLVGTRIVVCIPSHMGNILSSFFGACTGKDVKPLRSVKIR